MISLYGPRMTPPPEALAKVDAVLVDIQDVGARVYTFAATLAKVMEAAGPREKRLWSWTAPTPSAGCRWKGICLGPSGPLLSGPTPCPCATA